MPTVYKLQTDNGLSNEYGINRDETWEMKIVSSFENEEDAKQYVRDQTAVFPTFILRTHMLRKNEKLEMLEKFCFDDVYLLERRLFVVKDSNDLKQLQKKIVSHLKSNHVKVILI